MTGPNVDVGFYGCGSPVRLPVLQALANGASSGDRFFPELDPVYRGGRSVVWGLIRGAPTLMSETRDAGFDFYQVDNAYFGRNVFYRVTKNALQLTDKPSKVVSDRYQKILTFLGKPLQPAKARRSGPIVVCPSSDFMFKFMGTSLQQWLEETLASIKRHTDRPVVVRSKELVPTDIDEAISDAWCVVTHVSAAALDALRLGIPVLTTGLCAASPLSISLREIDSARVPNGRDELFSYLAHGQFTMEEMRSVNVVKLIDELTAGI